MKPDPPKWALDAGLPKPERREDFSTYVTRLGISADELLAGLTEQTACLAHVRFESRLIETMPEQFRRHVRARAARVRRGAVV